MNVFVDYHHGALYHSFSLLFEKRLGGQLFRPIGYDWSHRGIWKYSENPATIEQYLKIRDGVDVSIRDEYYLCPDASFGENHKALTLDQFMNYPIDLVIASVVNHEFSFYELVKHHKPRAKYARQMGNINDSVDIQLCQNILVSSRIQPDPVLQMLNLVQYHPEFEADLFSPQPPYPEKRIVNLMNCLPHSRDFPLWGIMREALPEFSWEMYGILGEKGILPTVSAVAQAIHRSSFIWHVKWGGDGYGYTIHQAFAAGRPPITRCSYYTGLLASDLMIPGETCIDLDAYEDKDTATAAIREAVSPERHSAMCEAAACRFREVVDFDAEEASLRNWVDDLR